MKTKSRKRRTLAQLGRDAAQLTREENIEAVIGFEIGEALQYYDRGWRYGHLREVGQRGKRRGMVCVEHPTTGTVWIEARDLKKLKKL